MLKPLERRIVLLLTLVIAATRPLAFARSLWDWDEALFVLAVDDYDVARHHPHPPGYPIFVAAAKLVHLLGLDSFRSLQVVVLLASCLLFPVLFLLARELGFRFPTAVCGAALFSFFPNVWFYSGTAFSDIPGAVLGFAACALLLAGRRNVRAYFAGAVVLGLAVGIRTPNLVIAFVPAVVATVALLSRGRWEMGDRGWSNAADPTITHPPSPIPVVLLSLLLGATIAAACYLGAILASTSFDAFLETVRTQQEWVQRVDSWRNPSRPPLAELWKLFWFRPFEQKRLMLIVAVLGAVSLAHAIVRRRWDVLLTCAVFAPLAFTAWLTLDFTSVSRYAIAYLPAHALLAADGLGVLAMPLRKRAALAQALGVALLAGTFAFQVWPGLRDQRTTISPPVAAIDWALRNTSGMLYVHTGLGPHGELLLAKRQALYFETGEVFSMVGGPGHVIDFVPRAGGMNFFRERGVLREIARPRNFEASVSPLETIRFGEGWYGAEGLINPYRWMSAAGTIALAKPGTVSITITAPANAVVEARSGGVLLERFTVAQGPSITKTWRVPSAELRLTTSATVNPSQLTGSGDRRELGLRLEAIRWSP